MQNNFFTANEDEPCDSNMAIDQIDNPVEEKKNEVEAVNLLNGTNQPEIIRLIEQYLASNGYQDIAETLAEQSKVPVEHHRISNFKRKLISGEFEDISRLVSDLIGSKNSQQPGELKLEYGVQKLRKMHDRVGSNFVSFEDNHTKVQVIIEYMIYEQKYMELMESGQTLEAISILQKELRPRSSDQNKLHQLAQLIMFQPKKQPDGHEVPLIHQEREVLINTGPKSQDSQSEFQKHCSWWSGSGLEGRQNLLDRIAEILPSDWMLQSGRLEQLLQQSLSRQLGSCRYHNVLQSEFSLLENHECSKDSIPTKCVATLNKHKEQVWLVQFSQSGLKLASMCKNCVICIWSVTKVPRQQQSQQNNAQFMQLEVKCLAEITTGQEAISSMNWSNTSDKWILSAGQDKMCYIWDSNNGKLMTKLDGGVSETIQHALFSHDDSKIFTVSRDHLLIVWRLTEIVPSGSAPTLTAVKIQSIDTMFYEDLAISKTRLVSHRESQAKIYCFGHYSMNENDMPIDLDQGTPLHIDQELYDDNEYTQYIKVNAQITSVNLNKDGRYLLLNISMEKPRIELWNLANIKFEQQYEGHLQKDYILRPMFGGVDDSLVLCGSEDTFIYVWSRKHGYLLSKIAGHCQLVNSVSWCPTEAQLFASGSDDGTIKLYGSNLMQPATILSSSKCHKVDQSGRQPPARNSSSDKELSSEENYSEPHNDEESDSYDSDEDEGWGTGIGPQQH